ncbi:hypothetical protein ASL14_19970 [Paenibacillus sp. IHB B 3084]|uniref:DUF4879 domain-containing protein n=1 Tax=unclassified Paenibacillus TaxID=185978 RepID=UPI00071ED122|nr:MULTISPECIES: DUF4879 domain-containing protein [unclassified Paenibacillus]ALP38120.1 hypothetical protein ASL14_19970 [Paenibacillus sp. IHB B 3084]MBE0339384.1 DUF4879 domain-containing protein [Paenibacillus sp. 23TSA30-6]
MKKLCGLALILVLALSFNVSAFAKGDDTQAQPLTKEEIVNSDEFLAAVEAAKATFESQKADESKEAKNNDGPIVQASAPPVSHINVYAVASPYGGQEIYGFNSNPFNTNNDHHGDWIQCITYQIGYDNSHYGKLGGSIMTNNWTEPLDLNGDSIIDAWARSWIYEGTSEGGQFVSTVRSANSPWNTAEAWINVR